MTAICISFLTRFSVRFSIRFGLWTVQPTRKGPWLSREHFFDRHKASTPSLNHSQNTNGILNRSRPADASAAYDALVADAERCLVALERVRGVSGF